MDRLFGTLGAVFGALGVAAGAFGAHALRNRLMPEMLAVFETGARYQMYHALAIILCGIVGAKTPGWIMQAGIVLFSGSLYALAVTGVRVFGAITPLGGLAFIAGWACLAWAAVGRGR